MYIYIPFFIINFLETTPFTPDISYRLLSTIMLLHLSWSIFCLFFVKVYSNLYHHPHFTLSRKRLFCLSKETCTHVLCKKRDSSRWLFWCWENETLFFFSNGKESTAVGKSDRRFGARSLGWSFTWINARAKATLCSLPMQWRILCFWAFRRTHGVRVV